MLDNCVFCNFAHNKKEICGDYRCHELLDTYLIKYLNFDVKNLQIKKNIIFKCINCDRIFGSKLGLDYHFKKAVCKKDKDKTFICEKCDKVFTEKKIYNIIN